ncbi:class I SAM-dependent methyltransferase [Ramlibacter sp. AN1015]|uniref:class I SAM-dependent methyltransferase n=1 Tax=Ramlibacter sp. AN1015 TaxID=3133428 RepID=UPI0030BBF1F0
MAISESKLNVFMENFVRDAGAVMHAATVFVGDQLGLYKALAQGPATAAELAARTSTDTRYLLEWLSAQAASGYVEYDGATQRFFMTEEQAFALAQEDSPAFVPGAFQIAVAQFKAIPKMMQAMRTGLGLGWHEHDPNLFRGTERFFRPGYAANLVDQWIPAIEGLPAMLERGVRVADVGCGHGASTLLMARAYPASRFVGFDYHAPSIEHASTIAREAGFGSDRLDFQVAGAADYPGRWHLVTFFDCLHDMGDPVGAARHVREALEPDGVWMLVEPFSNERLEDNINPVGRVFYSASTFICTPASRSQPGARCLGAQAGEQRLREVAQEAGFRHFRRAAQTPFNLIFEVKP